MEVIMCNVFFDVRMLLLE